MSIPRTIPGELYSGPEFPGVSVFRLTQGPGRWQIVTAAVVPGGESMML